MPRFWEISMRLQSYLIAGLSGALLLTACGNPTSTPNVRSGPQSQHPVTYGPNHVPATPGQTLAAVGSVDAVLEGTGISAADIGEAVFGDADRSTDLSRPIALFQSACLKHSPDVAAIARSATESGLDVERPSADQVYASEWTDTATTSLQVNMESAYAFECATTSVVSQSLSAKEAQTTFFNTLGLQPTNGEATTTIDGSRYIISHKMFDGGGFGVNEHAFLLRSNTP